jgi:hypothetical protein
VFLDQDPRRQRVDRVIVVDRHGGLQHDRSAIEFERHQVHGCAGDFHAVRERLLLRIGAGKGRQQRGMDVEDRVGEGVDERRADQIA